uniref:cAMP-dependent protein kinase inhibitor beta n=1 Tax=Gadus morhua TaxID=8049 RepID=A0A8C5FK09_GADMO
MTDVEPVVTDFASTARTGRRNAIPDLLGAAAGPSGSAELSNKLAELSVVGADMLLCLLVLVRNNTRMSHKETGLS